ncbi:peptidoglycan DD-metalloendopeptidase family protein [Sphingopyxis sp. BSNA05]|uniref:peptidoglycan DD-metalloendopeptidase family protein n=1 Tax=Sphingopyxis sp. BSNA05 TaxID=1236614 RepID=UPI00349F2D24
MRHIAILILLLAVTACIPPGRADYTLPPPPPELPTDPVVYGTAPEQAPLSTWQASPVTANARRVESGTYIVQPGDTLRGIANKTGAGSQIIASANGLDEPYVIHPGQRLKITAGRYHAVKSGETGIAIARAYGAPWREVVTLNELEEPYILRVGQKLLLPSSAPSDPTRLSIEQRAAAFDLEIDDIVTGSQPALADGAAAGEASDWRKAITPNTTIATPAGFSGRFQWPVNGRIISSFGSKGGGKVNDGLNIGVPRGTPIRASADGVIAYSGDEIGVFGGLILINHGSGWVTAYGHADKLNVTRGQNVKAGDIIGLAGESGYVQEPQLHFEIRKDRKPVDPNIHLPKRG